MANLMADVMALDVYGVDIPLAQLVLLGVCAAHVLDCGDV